MLKIEPSEKLPTNLKYSGSRKRKRPFHGLSVSLSHLQFVGNRYFSEGSIRFLAGLALATISLNATTCKDLCHKFGDESGCVREAAGEIDCTLTKSMNGILASPHKPVKSPVASHTAAVSPDKASRRLLGADVRFHTRWKHQGGIRMRFDLTVGDDHISFVGKSVPQLDPYFVRFTPVALTSDHILPSDSMACRRVGVGSYRCKDDTTGDLSTVLYSRTGGRAFDLKVFDGDGVGNGQLSFRLSSDGGVVRMRLYRDGRVIDTASEDLTIAH